MTNRDLDAEIVETIFDWEPIYVGKDAFGKNSCEVLFDPNKEATQEYYNWLPRVGKIYKGFFAPRYSSDLKEAIKLCKYVNLPLTVLEMSTDPESLAKGALDYWKMNDKSKL